MTAVPEPFTVFTRGRGTEGSEVVRSVIARHLVLPERVAGLPPRALYLLVPAALSALYLTSPDGWGGLAFAGTAGAGFLAFVLGPLARHPVNRRPWRWLAVAGGLFMIELILRLDLLHLPGGLGPLRSYDVWAFAGYLATVPFLAGLLRRTHSGRDVSLWLDTAAITTGSVLLGWVFNVAPQLDRPDPHLGSTVTYTMYPVMDALLLTLTLQLAFRRGAQVVALRAAIFGMAALLGGDLAYTFIWADHPGELNAYVNVCYVFAYASLGLMAVHPSMRELSDVDAQHEAETSRVRLTLLLLALLAPAAIPVMLPTHGVLDAAVRGLIMVVFATLIFLRLLGTIRDLQASRAVEARRRRLDTLTSLPNRVALLEYITAALTVNLPPNVARPPQNEDQPAAAGPARKWLTVLVIDCDHLKNVNDTWGRAAGDQILRQLTARLAAAVPAGGYVARLEGDEFAVCLHNSNPSLAAELAKRFEDLFQAPFPLGPGRDSVLSGTVGLVQHDLRADLAATAEDLVRDAEIALSQAKKKGQGAFAVYDEAMRERIARSLTLADALHGALQRDELYVVYQGIRGGPHYEELTGWEALVRWRHPELGEISPGVFIPIAEETGLIVAIGAMVLERAAAQLKTWQESSGRTDLHMSVNLSTIQVQRADVPALVSGVLADTGLTPDNLWLEITESVLAEGDDVITTLNELAGLGVLLCMDDFGTGYSSLSYLQRFPLHILKIDREFIKNLTVDPRSQAITRTIIALADALKLRGTIAEGVEKPEEAALLERLGCTAIQGFLFSKPLPADLAEAALRPALRPPLPPALGHDPGDDDPEGLEGSAPADAVTPPLPVPRPGEAPDPATPSR